MSETTFSGTPWLSMALAAECRRVWSPASGRPARADATEVFTAAVSLLQDDLVRNDPRTARALTVGWDRLREIEVRVDDELRVRVEALIGHPPIEIDVATKTDAASGVLFLRDRRLLRQVDGGGRAVANLFAGADRRSLAQAWLAMCVAADEGRTAQRQLLADQEAAEERAEREREMAERTAAFGKEIAGRQEGRSRRRPGRAAGTGSSTSTSGGGAAAADGQVQPPSPQPRPRVLVDPSTLVVLNPDGRPGDESSRGTRQRRGSGRRSGPLPSPNRGVGAPRGTTAAPGFTSLDKESVGMALARMVLAGDGDEIADLRAQHGVGADAVDSLDRFFELKVHLGDEPDAIRLEESEIRRALSTPDFFLVVVSNVEGPDPHPKVRIIVDPVHQLTMTPTSSVSFTGVRDVQHSLVYDLGPEAATEVLGVADGDI